MYIYGATPPPKIGHLYGPTRPLHIYVIMQLVYPMILIHIFYNICNHALRISYIYSLNVYFKQFLMYLLGLAGLQYSKVVSVIKKEEVESGPF